jgi:hypothetical protein
VRLGATALVCAVAAVAGCGGAAQRPALAPGAQIDLSREAGTQAETRVAVDPAHPSVLLVGAIDPGIPRMVAYSSTDGGRRWTTAALRVPGSCVFDPAVGIDRRGREYYAFLAHPHCDHGGQPHVFVATRNVPNAAWRIPRTPVATYGAGVSGDDRPALLVDNGVQSRFSGRVYVAWTRIRPGILASSVLLAHSDDGGRTWSKPIDTREDGEEAALAVAADGTLYLAFTSSDRAGMFLLRSADGGRSFSGLPTQILTGTLIHGPTRGQGRCHDFAGTIPALPKTCVRPDPSVVAQRGGVVVTYGARGPNGSWDVFVAGFTPALRRLFGGQVLGPQTRVTPPEGGRPSDQFQAVSTGDPQTGLLWTCFYDTGADTSRRSARWSCATSADGGRRWTKPVAAASAPSDETRPGADPFAYGDYEGVAAAAGGRVVTVWTDDRRPVAQADDIFMTWMEQRAK